MKKTSLVITSIATDNHPVLKMYAQKSVENGVDFIMIGDTKSPQSFSLNGCSFYGVEDQKILPFHLSSLLPFKHYSRKNLGYLIAMKNNSDVIIETDDDNIPFESFWMERDIELKGFLLENANWVNIYMYFTRNQIWPRGFALEALKEELPQLDNFVNLFSPIQQGLADENPDVDAIFRLIFNLPISFDKRSPIGIGKGSICPFNSQNTTWFKDAFPLLYLPSFCSFRMTDIWRSFVAQRIAWEQNWSIIFHSSTVYQERNHHDLMHDFKDEIPGYTNNYEIVDRLRRLKLKKNDLFFNLKLCYNELISIGVIDSKEFPLIEAWEHDCKNIIN